MGYASGIYYEGASIMLLDAEGSNGPQTGNAGGSGSYSWTLSWNDQGFIGQGWVVAGDDYSAEAGYTEADYQIYGEGIAINMKLRKAGCSTWVAI